MGAGIDKFCNELRTKLTNIDDAISGLRTKIDNKASDAEQDVRRHLEEIQARVEQERDRLQEAELAIKQWTDDERAMTSGKIAEWKANYETARLAHRAQKAERYAQAAAEVAAAAIANAEQAALEAWLARKDAGQN